MQATVSVSNMDCCESIENKKFKKTIVSIYLYDPQYSFTGNERFEKKIVNIGLCDRQDGPIELVEMLADQGSDDEKGKGYGEESKNYKLEMRGISQDLNRITVRFCDSEQKIIEMQCSFAKDTVLGEKPYIPRAYLSAKREHINVVPGGNWGSTLLSIFQQAMSYTVKGSEVIIQEDQSGRHPREQVEEFIQTLILCRNSRPRVAAKATMFGGGSDKNQQSPGCYSPMPCCVS